MWREKHCEIPSIVKAELIYGAMKSVKRSENLEKIKRFLMPFEIIPFDENAAYYYGEMRAALEKNGTIIGPNDLVIASTVLSQNGILITNNVKEFSRVLGIQLENWTISE